MANQRSGDMGFEGLHILTLESRRADLVHKLVVEQGGECFNAPSVRERPLETNPQAILCYRLEQNLGAKLIGADPRVSKTARLADLYLPLKPRSDLALLNGIAHILIHAGLIDRDYIDAHTTGFDELEKHLEKYTPERVAAVTGLSEELIYRAALLYGRAKAPFIGWTMGVNHSTKGAETVNAICNLALLTGKIGRPGASPFSITGQCNAMGTRETGFTSGLPGYRVVRHHAVPHLGDVRVECRWHRQRNDRRLGQPRRRRDANGHAAAVRRCAQLRRL